jgi:hypothetical protein
VKIREGEGFNRSISIGLLLSPRCQPNRTKRKGFRRSSMPREISTRFLAPFGRFEKIPGREKERKRDSGFIAEFQIQK